jgi:hypothetical protein
MADDLRRFLEKWPYDPEEPIRAVHGRDGRRKLQLRLPLGVEQYELDGRPDGARPRGCTSLLVFWEGRLRTFRRRRGSDAGFVLPDDACRDLRDEALLYYSRYILLFQLGEYGRCARDTARNLRCLDLIRRYGRTGETWDSLEHYRPYIVRMNRASRALLAMQRNQYDIALGELRAGGRTIEDLPAEDEMGLKFEKRVVYDAYLALRSLKDVDAWKHGVRICRIPTDTHSPVEFVKLKLYAYWPPGVYYFDNASLKEAVGPIPGEDH